MSPSQCPENPYDTAVAVADAMSPDDRRAWKTGAGAFAMYLLSPETTGERDAWLGARHMASTPWLEALKTVFWVATSVAVSLVLGGRCTP